MRLQLRAKHGQGMKVVDENGAEIEGVKEVELRARDDGAPEVMIVVQPVAATLDVEASIQTLPPVPAKKPADSDVHGGADGGDKVGKGAEKGPVK